MAQFLCLLSNGTNNSFLKITYIRLILLDWVTFLIFIDLLVILFSLCDTIFDGHTSFTPIIHHEMMYI